MDDAIINTLAVGTGKTVVCAGTVEVNVVGDVPHNEKFCFVGCPRFCPYLKTSLS